METFAVIPVITGVVEVIKRVGLPSRFAGLLALILGVGFSIATNKAVEVETVLMGIVFGLSASGIYDGVKQGVEPTKNLIGKMVK